ncbi:hypothetical protein FRC14_001696 [Serendipita sp. 396]|nr:hypothetical protein FRC14_001696 [Serendipita sp. 396]
MVAMAGLVACAPVPTYMGLESTSAPRPNDAGVLPHLRKRALNLDQSPFNPHISGEENDAIATKHREAAAHWAARTKDLHESHTIEDKLAKGAKNMASMYRSRGEAANAEKMDAKASEHAKHAQNARDEAQTAGYTEKFHDLAGQAHSIASTAKGSHLKGDYVLEGHKAWVAAVENAKEGKLDDPDRIEDTLQHAKAEKASAERLSPLWKTEAAQHSAAGQQKEESNRDLVNLQKKKGGVGALTQRFEAMDFAGGAPTLGRAVANKLLTSTSRTDGAASGGSTQHGASAGPSTQHGSTTEPSSGFRPLPKVPGGRQDAGSSSRDPPGENVYSRGHYAAGESSQESTAGPSYEYRRPLELTGGTKGRPVNPVNPALEREPRQVMSRRPRGARSKSLPPSSGLPDNEEAS